MVTMTVKVRAGRGGRGLATLSASLVSFSVPPPGGRGWHSPFA